MEDKNPFLNLKEQEQVLAKLSILKDIKPKEEWVILARKRIFEAEPAREEMPLHGIRFSVIFKRIGSLIRYMEQPAFVMPVLASVILTGVVWHAAQSSLPGDTLYPIKAAAEHVPMTFSSEAEKPFLQLELAQKKLDDLKRVAEGNMVKNLPLAIKEFEANISEISESLTAIVEKQPGKALQASRGVVRLQKEKLEVEKILGTKIGEKEDEELDNATKLLVENELADLETRLLTEAQEELFQAAKTAHEQGDYQTALEKIWLLSL